MKKIALIITTILAISVSTTTVKAQDYNASIGLSLGAPMGIDYKQFFSPRSAINATFGYTFKGNSLTIGAVYQYHIPLIENLNLYAGAGVNFGGMYLGSKYNKKLGNGDIIKYSAREFLFGITPNIGIEYKFENAPIAIGLDYRPSVNFTTASQWNQASLKVRYTF